MGAAATMGAGCAYIPHDEPVVEKLPASAKAEIDGDLVYFNWADYLAPSVVRGFQKEYGVKVIESNYDSMEGMYAKLAAGNQYDIVFPSGPYDNADENGILLYIPGHLAFFRNSDHVVDEFIKFPQVASYDGFFQNEWMDSCAPGKQVF